MFAVDKERKRVLLTLKKSLVDSVLPIVASIDEVTIGSLAMGVVIKVLEKGILVEYIGGLKAFIPKKELR